MALEPKIEFGRQASGWPDLSLDLLGSGRSCDTSSAIIRDDGISLSLPRRLGEASLVLGPEAPVMNILATKTCRGPEFQ